MWLLSCDDPICLGGRREWLKPGSEKLLGRSGKNQLPDVTVITNGTTTISRRHLRMFIRELAPGDGTRLHIRPLLKVLDAGGKYGTVVNGVKVPTKPEPENYTHNIPMSEEQRKSLEVILTSDVNELRLGKHNASFWIKYEPVVLSIQVRSEEQSNPSIMEPYAKKVERAGIKTIPRWHETTTHVVVPKRNGYLSMQALINGRHLVTEKYIDAIAEQVKVVYKDGCCPLTELERDFDKNWPNPVDFLPPQELERATAPDSAYQPDPRRKTLFNGWSFIFCSQKHYTKFLGIIKDAQGKLELFDWKMGEAEDLANSVRNRSNKTKVAVVRADDMDDDFVARVEQLLGFKMLELGDFLQPILSLDLTLLRKPLEGSGSNIPHKAAVYESPVRPNLSVVAEEPSPSPPPHPAPSSRPARGRVPGRRTQAPNPFALDSDEEVLPIPAPIPESQAAPDEIRTSFSDMLPPFSTSVGAGGATQPQSRARRGGRRVVAPNPFAIDSDDEAESVGSCGSMIANPASSTAPNPPPPNREQPRTPSVTTSMVFASSDLPTPLAQFTPASRRVVSPLKRVATSPLQRELREQMGEKAKAGQGKWKGKEKEINPDENLELDDLLQGSKGYKKRKIAEEEERRKAPAQATQATQAKEVKATKGAKTSKGKEKEVQAPQSASPEPEPTQATQTKGKGKAKPKPTATPFSTQAALIREAEQKKEAAAAATAEEVSNSIDSLKNLSIIGSISVKPHNERSSARVSVSLDSNASSSRWNPAWEGKKNFKAFRSKHSQVAETEPPAAVVEEPADATPPSAQKPPAPVPAARVTRSTRSKGPKLFVSLVDSNPDEPQARSRNTSVAATRASSRNTPIPPTTKVTKSKQSTAEPEPVRRGGRVRAESSVDPEPAQLPTARRTVRGRVVRGSSTQAEATQPTQTQIQATQGTKRVPRSQAGPGSKRTRSRQVEEVDDDDDDGDDDDEDGGDDRFKFKLPGRRRR